MNTTTARGRAFRRIGGAALVTGAAACTVAALIGTLPAQASTPPAAAAAAAAARTTAQHHTLGPAATSAQHAAALRDAELRKIQRAPGTKNLNAYYAAGYKYEDALDLAALWNSADRNHAKSTAGADLRAGHALPFAPGTGFTRSYTTAQQLRAYEIAEVDDARLADRLATAWKVSPAAAKAKAGALALANRPVPLEHPTPSAGDASTAFTSAGYDYTDAVKLAQIWKIDAYSAKVRAGQDLLSSPQVPLPIQP
ncbi:hypothetical protein [Curtobacterium sp. L1-20]|uniref:hypothetical protein n=1 Tax=Curtobacterium sp. L1-20 TaxID=3138181 RepID=UPI003B51B561